MILSTTFCVLLTPQSLKLYYTCPFFSSALSLYLSPCYLPSFTIVMVFMQGAVGDTPYWTTITYNTPQSALYSKRARATQTHAFTHTYTYQRRPQTLRYRSTTQSQYGTSKVRTTSPQTLRKTRCTVDKIKGERFITSVLA